MNEYVDLFLLKILPCVLVLCILYVPFVFVTCHNDSKIIIKYFCIVLTLELSDLVDLWDSALMPFKWNYLGRL